MRNLIANPVGRLTWWQKTILGASLMVFLLATGVFVYLYVRYARVIDARLSGEVFANASLVFAAPTEVRVGQPGSAAAFAERLRRAFYAEGASGSDVGTYKLAFDRLEVYPGPKSFFEGDQIQEGPAALVFKDGHLAAISDLDHGTPLANYWLEPVEITTLFGQARSKRRLVRYQDSAQGAGECHAGGGRPSLFLASRRESSTAFSAPRSPTSAATRIAGRQHADHATGARILPDAASAPGA